MSRPVKSGRVLQSGVVRAAEIAAELGLDPSPGKPGTPPLSPADQRRVEEGKKPIGPSEDHEVTVLSEADIWDAFGRPTLGPPPDAPDGTPCPIEPKRGYEPERRRPDEGAAMNAPSAEESAAEVMREAAEQATQIRKYVRADAERVKARAKAAMENGSPEERKRAAADARAVAAFGQRVKEKIGLS